MAENNTDKPIVEPATLTPEELARKMADQGREVLKPGDIDTTDSQTALDALAGERSKKNTEDAEAEEASRLKAAEEEEAARKKAEEEAKLGKSGASPAPDPAKAVPAGDAPKASANDPFPDEQLPAGSRGKSAEAFAKVKLLAAQEIAKLSTRTVELETKIKEYEEKLKNPIPAELENEIKELRAFRAKLDIEVDPRWKEFDKRADGTAEFIYSQLKQHSSVIDADTIEQIKKFGGPLGVNMQKILDAINDPNTSRMVQAKLADLAQIRFEKEQAKNSAKANADEYLTARSKEMEQATVQHTELTKQAYAEITKKMEWLVPRQATKDATEDDKKAIAEHNKWVEDTNKELAIAAQDDSPQMRAIMLAGMSQLFYIQREHGKLKTESAKQISDLEGKLKAANDTIERFKRSSTTRIRDVPTTGQVPAAKEVINPNMTAAESLDALARKVTEARNASPA